MQPRWADGPDEITLVRHGHSVGNEADNRARESEAERLELDDRDADVELSETGRDQAEALRAYLAELDGGALPTFVLSSPYERAAQTAQRALGFPFGSAQTCCAQTHAMAAAQSR